MANYCDYKCIVKGKMNACYAVFGSMPCADYKDIVFEDGTDDEYMIQFEENTKWAVDAYCEKIDKPKKLEDIPDDPDEAMEFGEDYMNVPQCQKSKLFDVEFYCNSADTEDYDLGLYGECGGFYEHYLPKSSRKVKDECPEDIYIRVEEDDYNL